MIVESLTVGPIQTNVYIVGCPQTQQGAIIDAGGDADGLLRVAEQRGIKIDKILQTHAHIDHVAAIPEVRRRIDAPIYLHPADAQLWKVAPQQGQMFGIHVGPLPDYDVELADGDQIDIGELRAQVFFLPGHSPGHVAFYFEAHDLILSGDVLFAGSIGRVDLPGSDRHAMKRSLERISALPDQTRVLSGHGPETTIGREKKTNPFLRRNW